MDKYKGMEQEGFWFEMQELAHSFSDVIKKYGMEDQVISAIVVGVLEPVDEETSNMRAFFYYNLETQEELDVVKDFMTNSYSPSDDDDFDIDGLLDGLGISLN